MYSLVIGILAAVGLAIFVVSKKMDSMTSEVFVKDGAEYQAALLGRISPVGDVYRSGEEQESSAPTVETPEEPDPVATAMSGPQVYNTACLVCHGAGIGGAPVLGDKAQWVERIAQGPEMLRRHAVEGYTGSTGFMPAKGGRMDLSDAEVEAAVDYMVSESQ